MRLYTALNAPAKAGRVWVQYERKTIDAALDVLKQLMVAQGYEFRPADALPAERDSCAKEERQRDELLAAAEAASGNPDLASLYEQYTKDPASLTPESFALLRKHMARAAGPSTTNNNTQD